MRIKEGDVFTMSAVDAKISIGQVLQKNKHAIYIVIFSKLYDTIDPDKLNSLLEDVPAIVARTSDLYFKLKRWTVLGNVKKLDTANFYPNYKIETLQGVFVMNFDRQVIRKASKAEEDFYFFYSDFSPAWVVGALQAFHGLKPMDDDYLKLTYDFIKVRSNCLN